MPQKLKVEIEIPNWVNWIAVDQNGFGYGYHREPTPGKNYHWDTPSMKRADLLKPRYTLLYKGPKPKNWKTELYHWK